MTISAAPYVRKRRLFVRGEAVLSDVPDNVVVAPVGASAAFIGATADAPSSRHVFTLGVLQGYRLLCLFRFKIWWMIPRVGKSGSDVPFETQMLLLEAREGSALDDEASTGTSENTFYVLLLPVLDGDFRASLQGNSANEIQLCVESGDCNLQTTEAFEALFINSGDNPYDLLKSSVKLMAGRKGTFCHVENKKIPAYLDRFGWCTWDAFYKEVDPQGIIRGLQSLSEGGSPAGFLIIDDGWQETVNEIHKEGEPFIEGTQFVTRLVDIKENKKFRGSDGGAYANLQEFITTLKEEFGLRHVFMWHALAGYWGGVLPTSDAMKKYNPKIAYPKQSPGNIGNLRDIVMDSLEKYGIGIVDTANIYDFYNDMHSYLSKAGVDGVKVDVQNVIETLGSGLGGRASLTRSYQQALEKSVARNFKDNSIISCMSHNSDYIFSSMRSAVARASEDFMPREPAMQTLHVASVSFNSLLLGEIVVPDWDIFQSKHVTAEFHGAARAIGGCGVCVSDKPGEHDFEILRKLVLPDGSVLRARHAGRPTRDCLFDDPVMDGKSLLKIWNMNKYSGVVGVFNCQGAGSWPLQESGDCCPSKPMTISGKFTPSNVEHLEELAGEGWTGDCAVFTFNSGCLSRLHKTAQIDVSLSTLQCEIYTVSPIQEYYKIVEFAPLGLIDMFNSGGAVEEFNSSSSPCGRSIKIKGRGSGRFGAYSNRRPLCCVVDGVEAEFDHHSEDGFLILNLPVLVSTEGRLRHIEITYQLSD